MIGSNLSISVDSRIPCRVHLVCRNANFNLEEMALTGIADLSV